jgi:ubiquinone biosynthesis UbiH/UbiF/VisC/COQ6 family hydroxylase
MSLLPSVRLQSMRVVKRLRCAAAYPEVCSRTTNRLLLSRAFSTSNTTTEETDVLIVGGGVVGCALARLLNRRAPQLKVGLVEAGKGPRPIDYNNHATIHPHPRSYAMSPASLRLLGLDANPTNNANTNTNAGATQQRLGYYNSMQVWESHQPASLIFQEKDLPEKSSYLGAVVEDGVLQDYLWKELTSMSSEAEQSCRIWKETTVAELSYMPDTPHGRPCEVVLQSTNNKENGNSDADGAGRTQKISTKLLVAADGANSGIRNLLGMSVAGFDYEDEQALTFTVALDTPHGGRAFQRFSDKGVVALLPTWSPNHAVVVWSTTPDTVKQWKDHPDLVSHVNSVLQQGPGQLPPLFSSNSAAAGVSSSALSSLRYGLDKLVDTVQYSVSMAAQEYSGRFVPPPILTKTVSPQFAFPLACRQVSQYIQPRVALVGDAAHSVHPMAGQGLNLGLQDVGNLVDVVERAAASGMDPVTFLTEYDRSRRAQVSLTITGIHALHEMFGAQHTLAKHMKSLGMNFVQNVGPVRRSLVQAACQGVAVP